MLKYIRIYYNMVTGEFTHFLAPSSKASITLGTKKLHWQSLL